MPDSQSKGTYTQRASRVILQHANRTMKNYLVLESELDHIARLSTWAAFFWSAMFSCASFAFGLWSDLFIEGSPSKEATQHIPALEVVFVIGAILFFVLAIWATYSKRSEINRIKRETGHE